MDFHPWWCTTCEIHIPASALTHWDDGEQHPVRQTPAVGTPVPARTVSVKPIIRDDWVRHDDLPANWSWSAPGRYLTVIDNDSGDLLAEIKVVVARTPEGLSAYGTVAAALLETLTAVYAPAPTQ